MLSKISLLHLILGTLFRVAAVDHDVLVVRERDAFEITLGYDRGGPSPSTRRHASDQQRADSSRSCQAFSRSYTQLIAAVTKSPPFDVDPHQPRTATTTIVAPSTATAAKDTIHIGDKTDYGNGAAPRVTTSNTFSRQNITKTTQNVSSAYAAHLANSSNRSRLDSIFGEILRPPEELLSNGQMFFLALVFGNNSKGGVKRVVDPSPGKSSNNATASAQTFAQRAAEESFLTKVIFTVILLVLLLMVASVVIQTCLYACCYCVDWTAGTWVGFNVTPRSFIQWLDKELERHPSGKWIMPSGEVVEYVPSAAEKAALDKLLYLRNTLPGRPPSPSPETAT